MAASSDTLAPAATPSAAAAVGRWFDRWWWTIAAVLCGPAVYLNLDAQGMAGILPDYRCFRQVVVAGMDPAANHCSSPTFPMWGYGWVFAITESKPLLLVGQSLAAVGATWVLLRVLERRGLLAGAALRLVKALLVVSVPWYAFNALLWPYSEAVTLELVAVAALIAALARAGPAYGLVALSGLLFGLALNFRSDYIALPLLVAAAVVALERPRRLQAQRMAVWLAAVLVALVPWTVYAYRATGHLLLTSTNSGHVLYISLGQLPGNPWHITPSDGDPRMTREVDAHFHGPTDTLTYAADAFLRRRFFALVRQHPLAWLEKDAHNLESTLTGGFYEGEFLQEGACAPNCWQKYGFTADGSARTTSIWTPLVGHGLGPLDRVRYAVQGLSAAESEVVSLVGFLLTPVLLLLGLRRRSTVLTLVALLPAFQALVNVFSYYLPSYSSNAYVPLLVLVGVAGRELQARRARASR